MIIRAAFIAIFASTCLAAPAALALERRGAVTIKFAGEADWGASCSFEKAGKTVEIKRQGSGSKSLKSLAIKGIGGGTCILEVPEGTMLKVSFTGYGNIHCPFEDNDPCVAFFSAKDIGEFSF